MAAAVDRCVILSFEGVEMMDASFADEVFASLAAERGHRRPHPGCLALKGLNSTSRDNLQLALLSRPTREPGLRNCVLPVFRGAADVEFVGKTEEHVRSTLEILRAKRQLTARELAEMLRLDIAAASTRLKVVFDLGLGCRRETRDPHGRVYVYEWLV